MFVKFLKMGDLTLLLLAAIFSILLVGCAQPQPPPLSLPQTQNQPVSETEINQWQWRPSPGNILQAGYLAYLPPKGAYVTKGHTLTLSWQAESKMESFILTENQFRIAMSNNGYISNSIASGSGGSGSITATIPVSDIYYGVARNAIAGNSVKLYQATLSEQ